MSDRMTCIPFSQLLNWVFDEYQSQGTVFGVHQPYKAKEGKTLELFGRKLETPIGPAAGPHTQLAQNIISAYFAGSRFFEVKTVQIIDGEDLPVSKPCIDATDEGYNIEWSTELTVPDAMGEYIKAWVILHLMAKEMGLGAQDGFQFNMSVGYDLAGIRSEKINTFIDSMIEAKDTEVFKNAIRTAKANLSKFKHVTEADIDAIPSAICNSATISTLHGCPPKEIESIATYLITEKHLNTFVKCNPTLLGYDFARKTLDEMGYDYVSFGRFHFEDDLQYQDAVPMFERLIDLAASHHLQFGVKLTNTFPVDITRHELAGKEMYMSGKPLFALTSALAAKLSRDFDGKLRISYSGGADAFNIEKIVGAGIWPVTMATTILKPGGYQRFRQLAEKLEKQGYHSFEGVNVAAISKIAEDAKKDKHYLKPAKMPPSRKNNRKVPLLDCFIAGCEEGCPIHQDIPTYIRLTGEGKYKEALQVILDKNPLPFITGTLCAHPCMTNCVRNHYESPVNIRGVKLEAAKQGYESVMRELKPTGHSEKNVAIVGGGPAGIAAAFYLLRAGAKVTIFEKRPRLGGIVRYVIPRFRIDPATVINKDLDFIRQLGVEIHLNTEVSSVEDLKTGLFDAAIIAIGAHVPAQITIEGCTPLHALSFLEEFNNTKGKMNIGKNVVVIGGGNTAMDVARSAKRTEGVENVYLVYRRTKRYMPADEEELQLALNDGVIFKELLAPEKWENGELICRVMELGEYDESGRRSVAETDQYVRVAADTVISATGENVSTDFYQANGIAVDAKGKPVVNPKTLESSKENIYIVGDGLYGPSTIVQAIANSMKAASAIVGFDVTSDVFQPTPKENIFPKRGVLIKEEDATHESERCLSCSTVCENCVEVCPNRANVSIHVPGRSEAQIIHVDYMCNECGNCETFCPYNSGPYKDKFTLFANEKDMENSKNAGFVVLDSKAKKFKVRLFGEESVITPESRDFPEGIMDLMNSVCDNYPYLIFEK
ncbi:MAG TPA: putative selenate reductase subunit YgfK [Flexilinea sp.]|nr:putative selenate reductase subunit YgfK [Flexilinea sp.]HQG89295.1 putative selenate reductase subunit YgfK [Flexilinea sp.]